MPKERVSLKDVLNSVPGYEQQSYLTKEEKSAIKFAFKGNPTLFKAIKKLLLPTISDPDMPIEDFGDDIFNRSRTWSQIPAEEAKILAVARQDSIEFLRNALAQISLMVITPDETPDELADRARKNSMK